jgi:hypothetical protein
MRVLDGSDDAKRGRGASDKEELLIGFSSLRDVFGGLVSVEAEEGAEEGPSVDNTGYPSTEFLTECKEARFGLEEGLFKGPEVSGRVSRTPPASKLTIDDGLLERQ